MVESGYITQAQAERRRRRSRSTSQPNGAYDQHSHPYAFDYVVEQLHRASAPTSRSPTYCKKVDSGGLKIYTTIDPTKEAQARRAILAHEGGPGQPAAALTSIDPIERPRPGDRQLL